MTAPATAPTARELWLAERNTGIGGSDAASVMGCNPWKSLFALWAQKTGMAPSDEPESEAAEWGKRLEPVIAAKYSEVTKREVTLYGAELPKLIRHRSIPFMLGSLDADVRDRERHADHGDGILEIKTTGIHRADDWEEAAPLYYQVQVQHYLAVTDRLWASFAVLIGGQRFKWYDVERNDTFIAALEERCRWFWGMVERNEAPEPDGHPSTAAALKTLYPADSGETVDLGGPAIEWVAELEAAKAALDAAETRKREIENRIRSAMGAATYGVVPGLGRFSLKLQTREARVQEVKATSFRPLRFSANKEKRR